MATDPHWDDVTLLLSFDGNFTDKSPLAKTVTPRAGATISTTNVKFGTGAANFTRAGNSFLMVENAAPYTFKTQDLTVEGWARWPNPQTTENIIGVWYNLANRGQWCLRVASNVLGVEFMGPTGGTTVVGAPWTRSTGVWYHLALCVSGTDIRVFVNGVMVVKGVVPANLVDPVDPILGIATRYTPSENSATNLFGQLDEWRITSGVARYPTDESFAVPTEPYPTSGGAIVDVEVGAGEVEVEGKSPELTFPGGITARPDPGILELTGSTPALSLLKLVDAGAGNVFLTGSVPTLVSGLGLYPLPDSLVFTGFAPDLILSSGQLGSQAATLVLGSGDTSALASFGASLVMAGMGPPDVAASQTATLALAAEFPKVRSSQAASLILAHSYSCSTQKAQVWTIRRKDGEIFRYTSHDESLVVGGKVFKRCASLNPSASENASTLGSVGNIDLSGIIDDDGISEADLYGGLFDDAYVTVDLVEWGGGTDTPRRLASGNTGTLSLTDNGFSMEVLGGGARLEQQALVQAFTPGCRWQFGDTNCKVDIGPMGIATTVVRATGRGTFTADLPAQPEDRQWQNGRARFLTGRNAGMTFEVKEVDWTSKQVVLWAPTSFVPEAGDELTLLPGCDFNRDGGCTLYANVLNFGGFPDIPGADAILETPDAKY